MGIRLAFVALIAAVLASAAQAEPKKLTFSVFEPPQAFGPTLVYGPWAKDISAASKGTLDIEMLAGGQLGKPAAQLDLVENGVADMALVIPSFTPGRFPGNEVAELPFLWKDPSVAGEAISKLIANGDLSYPGIKVLGVAVTGPYQVHAAKPVKSLDDMKGLRLRAAGPVFAAATQALGAVPVGMPTPSVAENISRGVIDGTLQDWTLVKAFRIIDATPYHFDYNLGGVISLIVMNQKVYDSLPADAKAALEKYSAASFARRWGEELKRQAQKVIGAVKADPKQQAVFPDAAESKRWDEKLRPVADNWAKKSPENQALYDKFKKALGETVAQPQN